MLKTIFKFFASLKLALLILAALIVIFSVGTFIESYHGAESAQILVYRTPWLQIVLVLLVLNLLASALDRWPWKVKHIGFVLTHLGIILILLGSFVTHYWMLDAQMPIEEGKSEHQVTLTDPVIYLLSKSSGKEWRIPFKKHALAWDGEEALESFGQKELPFKMTLLKDYPKARLHEKLIQSEKGPASVQVTLKSSFMEQQQQLIEHDPQQSVLKLGPATLKFANEFLPEGITEKPEMGYLEFQFESTLRQIPLSENMELPQRIELEGMPYVVELRQLYRNALVKDNKLIEDEAADPLSEQAGGVGKNPAAVLILEGDGFQEKHSVFAKFPDFPTQHGMLPSRAGVRVFYRIPNSGSRGEHHELRFVKDQDELHYQIVNGFNVHRGKVEKNKMISTGWMDFAFRVDDFFLHSKTERSYTVEPNTSQSQQVFPAIQVQLNDGDNQKKLWLGQGIPEKFDWNGQEYATVYGQLKKPVGFKLYLKDFRVEYYPGTNQAASFESDVILKDEHQGVEQEATISMNEPLVYRGTRIFQASYSQAPGQPDVSIFSVGYDPGIFLKYSGTIVMVVGIIMIFYTRKYSTTQGRSFK